VANKFFFGTTAQPERPMKMNADQQELALIGVHLR
jgi:hypothetical protein